MKNDRLALLPPTPFVEALPALLDGIQPPAELTPIAMHFGAPTHRPPPYIGKVAAEHEAAYGDYPSTFGTPRLRDAIAGFLRRRYGLPEAAIDPARHVVPVNGTREGLFMIALAAVPSARNGAQPAVLVANPYYHAYAGAAVAAGAEPIYVTADRSTGFLPDFAAVDESILDRAAMIYLSSPANPQGAIASLDYLTALIRLARQRDIVLIVDECYSEIYADAPPPGGLEACHAMGDGFDNVVVFNSLSKRSSAPGVRSGFAAGDATFLGTFKRLRNYGSTATPVPLDQAAAALWDDDDYAAANRERYREKMRIADLVLGQRPGYVRPQGGFFLWLDVGDGEEATRVLWREAAVKVLPGAYVANKDVTGVNPGRPFVRIALVHDAETTREGLERIARTL